MQTPPKARSLVNKKSKSSDRAKVLSSRKSSKKVEKNSYNIKNRYDDFVRDLFMKIDIECSGFITSTKICHNKSMNENVFYFFGGLFQKVKQMGSIT